MSHPKFWLGFSRVPEIGPKRIAHLLNAFGDLQAAWTASDHALRAAGLDPLPTANLVRIRATLNLDREMEQLARAGITLLTWEESDYPALLYPLADAPPVLYIRGQLLPGDDRALGVVGTRKASTYGRDAAYHLSRQLAEQAVTIVSGLAHGIDAAAHRGALDSGGRTFAVLGSGVDIIYPTEHRALAHEICEQGALISAFPPGTRAEKGHFPRRNRLISGLALGVLVVEAPEKSGALITVESATEQGREVFAVPGSIFNSSSAGSNRLIQDGAKLVMNANDILNELNVSYTHREISAAAEQISPASPVEAQILGLLTHEPVHVDDLVRASQLPVSEIIATLTLLELKGLVRTASGMQYYLSLQGH